MAIAFCECCQVRLCEDFILFPNLRLNDWARGRSEPQNMEVLYMAHPHSISFIGKKNLYILFKSPYKIFSWYLINIK